MNSYQEMQQRHQQEIDAFPIMFAFNHAQFAEGMRKLGLNPSQTDQIVEIEGGGFIRKSDKQALLDTFARHRQERETALAADEDGAGYAYQMFLSELGNHEYCYTMDVSEALAACGLTQKEVNAKPNLRKALTHAIDDYLASSDE